MTKRAQQESGEGRVTAKSRPMMNLTARTPSFVSSSASSKPERTSYGYQNLERSVSIDDRTGKPEKPPPPGYSQEDYGRSWSSQERKSGAAEHDRSGNLRVLLGMHCKELTLIVRNFFSAGMRILQGTESRFTIERGNLCQRIAKNRLILKILSWAVTQAEFVNKVKDQVRNRQKRMSNVAEPGDEHSIIWECSWLQRYMRRHSWERISQLFKVSSRIMKVSH